MPSDMGAKARPFGIRMRNKVGLKVVVLTFVVACALAWVRSGMRAVLDIGRQQGLDANAGSVRVGKKVDAAQEVLLDVEQQRPQQQFADPLPCLGLQGAEDVVLVIKTGSTEALEKLPVHFNTTLRCFPNYLIFSDFGEVIDGHTIHDALDTVIEEIRLNNDDFALWRRLKEGGRAILDDSELSINDHGDNTDPFGNTGNGGWRLDKMKNLPMIGKTLELKPDAKWYIYVDADSYIVWSNLLEWTKQLDASKPLYLGNPTVIDDALFAHGGSGYLLSRPAMQAVDTLYKSNQAQWDNFTAEHWAGDCVLGTALQDVGVELTWSFPLIQGGDPTTMDWTEIGYEKRLWCYPAVSYHHLKPSTIDTLWNLEQAWLAEKRDEPLRHAYVFQAWILDRLTHGREEWDNVSTDVVEDRDVADAMACRGVCENMAGCMQFSFRDGVCRTGNTPRLGVASQGSQSGWMLGRVHELIKGLDECDEGDWILP